MLRKLTFILIIGLAMTMAQSARAFIVAGSENQYSSHSYEQAAPDTTTLAELLPEIIHNPLAEISPGQDFRIVATINNLGLGTPIIHYRFGNSKKYYTNVLKSAGPNVFDFKILSAALNDDKIDYYIEVSDGSRLLANYGTSKMPVSVKIDSSVSRTNIFVIIMLAIVAIIAVKAVSSAQKAKPDAAKIFENTYGSRTTKRARINIK
jgi:hypothetical protein